MSERSGRDLSPSRCPCRKCRSGVESSPHAPTRRPQPYRRPGRRAAARRRSPPVGSRNSPPTLYWDEQLLRVRRGGLPRRRDRTIRSAPTPRREDRRRGDVGASAAREVDHRAARRRPDRSTADRLAATLRAVRDRGGRAPLPPGAPPLAIGLVGGTRVAPPRARRPAHRPEPHGDARHLPHDVRHGGGALPGARSGADGFARPAGRVAAGSIASSARRSGSGRASPSGAPSRPNGRARSRCRSVAACARSGRSPAIGAAVAPASPIVWTLLACFVLVPIGCLPAELRRVLLSARIRRPRLPDPPAARCCATSRAHLEVQPENSAPWTWPLLLHPVRYLIQMRDGTSSTWWRSATPRCGGDSSCCCPSRARADRPQDRCGRTPSSSAATRRCSSRGSRSGRTQFIWYMLPAVPFMCLGVSSTLRRLPDAVRECRRASASPSRRRVVALALPAVWMGWWVTQPLARAPRMAPRVAALRTDTRRKGGPKTALPPRCGASGLGPAGSRRCVGNHRTGAGVVTPRPGRTWCLPPSCRRSRSRWQTPTSGRRPRWSAAGSTLTDGAAT